MSANRLDQWSEEVDGKVFTEPTERPSYRIPESWPTKRPPNADLEWIRRKNEETFRVLVREAIALGLIVLLFLAVWTNFGKDLNHGLGDGGNGGQERATRVGEPASVVQPVAHEGRR